MAAPVNHTPVTAGPGGAGAGEGAATAHSSKKAAKKPASAGPERLSAERVSAPPASKSNHGLAYARHQSLVMLSLLNACPSKDHLGAKALTASLMPLINASFSDDPSEQARAIAVFNKISDGKGNGADVVGSALLEFLEGKKA